MAKFGERFLATLTNPAYEQGLFRTAYGFGAAPRLREEQKEKERKEKGILGGTMAVQQAAQAGTLDQDMLQSYLRSMQQLGVPTENLLKNVNDLQTLNKTAQQKNLILEDFSQWASANNISDQVIKDINRGIQSGQLSTVQQATDLAVKNEQTAFKRDYYSNISTYDSGIGTLVQRGMFEEAEKRFNALKAQEKRAPAEAFISKFQNEGGIVTEQNRGSLWKAVVATTKDMDEATTMMNRLEDQSIQKQAAKYKGPTKTLTYIPKPKTSQQAALFAFGGTGNVTTSTIEAPIDPATGKIDAKWLANFRKHSAQTILELDDPTSNIEGTGIAASSQNPSPSSPKGQTPMDLARSMGSTAE
jgi:hypothetical protein